MVENLEGSIQRKIWNGAQSLSTGFNISLTFLNGNKKVKESSSELMVRNLRLKLMNNWSLMDYWSLNMDNWSLMDYWCLNMVDNWSLMDYCWCLMDYCWSLMDYNWSLMVYCWMRHTWDECVT
jgi:hypothetical protein